MSDYECYIGSLSVGGLIQRLSRAIPDTKPFGYNCQIDVIFYKRFFRNKGLIEDLHTSIDNREYLPVYLRHQNDCLLFRQSRLFLAGKTLSIYSPDAIYCNIQDIASALQDAFVPATTAIQNMADAIAGFGVRLEDLAIGWNEIQIGANDEL